AEMDRCFTGLPEGCSPAHGDEHELRTDRDDVELDRSQGCHACLRVEVVNLPEPLVECGIVAEGSAALRRRNEEAFVVQCRELLGVRPRGERRIALEEGAEGLGYHEAPPACRYASSLSARARGLLSATMCPPSISSISRPSRPRAIRRWKSSGNIRSCRP